MMKKILVPVSFVLVGAVGCGGGMSKEDATTSRATAIMAITKAVAAAPRGLTDAQTGDWTINDFSANCTGGGTIKISGTVYGGETSGSMDINATFTGCVESGLTMDGNLHYAFDVDVSGTTYHVKFIMEGEITFKGTVEGSCEFDVNMDADVTQSGGGSATVEGSICGVDVNETGSLGF